MITQIIVTQCAWILNIYCSLYMHKAKLYDAKLVSLLHFSDPLIYV